jgi:UDP-N-acetylmuramate dehydrogenase
MSIRIDETLQKEFMAVVPGHIRFYEPMSRHTTFRIGGPAQIWAEPSDEDELARLLGLAQAAHLPVTVVGGGANLLVRDEGIPGVVVRLKGPGFQKIDRKEASGELMVGAALPLEWLVRRAQELGLGGVEFLAGVPGSVGGAVRMNAGTRDESGKMHSMADVVKSVQVMDGLGRMRWIPADALHFRYRGCDLDGEIILSVALTLRPCDPQAIARRVERLWRYKKKTQDWRAPSAGCIFKNPGMDGNGDCPFPSAGWMIEQVGLKGYGIGRARFSDRHANFILNLGGASACDVLALIEEAQSRVFRRFGVHLDLEVRLLPESL